MAKVRVRVQPRFYIFLALLVMLMFLLIRQCGRTPLATVTRGSISGSVLLDAVLVRNEQVREDMPYGAITYLADEGALVYADDLVVRMYTSNASSILTNLAAVNEEIVAFQNTLSIGDLVNVRLDEFNAQLEELAAQLKDVSAGVSRQSVHAIYVQIEDLLTRRQEYIRSISPESATLDRLNNNKDALRNSLQGWRHDISAAQTGYISFYLDGGESWLRPELLDSLTAAQVRDVIGGNTQSPYRTSDASGKKAIFRIVDPNEWYVVLLAKQNEWSAPVGSTCQLQFQGHDDQLYQATVKKTSAEGNYLLVHLQMHASPGDMLNVRSIKARVGSETAGLLVPLKALNYQSDGSVGVYVSGGRGVEYVQVRVLSSDSAQASVEPLVPGALTEGMQVRLDGKGSAT